jgi:hypothetical protein
MANFTFLEASNTAEGAVSAVGAVSRKSSEHDDKLRATTPAIKKYLILFIIYYT